MYIAAHVLIGTCIHLLCVISSMSADLISVLLCLNLLHIFAAAVVVLSSQQFAGHVAGYSQVQSMQASTVKCTPVALNLQKSRKLHKRMVQQLFRQAMLS